MDEPTIGSRVEELCSLSGESLAELSRLAGASHSTFSGLTSGRWDDMKSKTASRLARVCGASLEWLVNGTGQAPSAKKVRAAIAAYRASQKKAA